MLLPKSVKNINPSTEESGGTNTNTDYILKILVWVNFILTFVLLALLALLLKRQ